MDNDIELVFYKGGEIEKKLCEELDIQSFNIENFNVEKVYSHNPYVEVNYYYNQLVEMYYIFKYVFSFKSSSQGNLGKFQIFCEKNRELFT